MDPEIKACLERAEREIARLYAESRRQQQENERLQVVLDDCQAQLNHLQTVLNGMASERERCIRVAELLCLGPRPDGIHRPSIVAYTRNVADELRK